MVRDANDSTIDQSSVTCPAETAKLFAKWQNADREHFLTLHLNSRNVCTSIDVVSIGTLNSSLVHPREVFKTAILNGAASIILAHNHPSGDVTPSREDIDLTKRMAQSGDILGIEILDHIIFAPSGRFLSMKEANLF